jgi:hypothetical protein
MLPRGLARSSHHSRRRLPSAIASRVGRATHDSVPAEASGRQQVVRSQHARQVRLARASEARPCPRRTQPCAGRASSPSPVARTPCPRRCSSRCPFAN